MKFIKQLPFLSFLCILAVVIVGFSSCETDIPEEDSTKPTVRLNIQGPNLNQAMDNPPREVWAGPGGTQYLNLLPGVPYEFVLLAADAGGVSSASIAVPTGVDISVDAPATISTSGIQQFVTVTGDASDPLTGLGITGTFTFPRGLAFDFNVAALDYGGTSGFSNVRTMKVTAFVN